MENWNVNNLPFNEAATNSIAMTLWAFLGLESAAANSDAVDNPEKMYRLPYLVVHWEQQLFTCYLLISCLVLYQQMI